MQALVTLLLQNGISVNYLTTSKNKIVNESNYNGFYWSPEKGIIDENCLMGVDSIINLAGANIAKRWTNSYKQEIIESRLLSSALLLLIDRSFGYSFFLSDIYIAGEVLHNQGGSPVLFEHLFWFLGHPEVYIVLLPALGITSEVIATNSRKPIFGYRAMIMSILAIAFLSTIVWGHHMFISGMNPFLGSVFTFTTLLIAIPSAVKAFNYITTLWKGNFQLNQYHEYPLLDHQDILVIIQNNRYSMTYYIYLHQSS